jgi:hypothetical protein
MIWFYRITQSLSSSWFLFLACVIRWVKANSNTEERPNHSTKTQYSNSIRLVEPRESSLKRWLVDECPRECESERFEACMNVWPKTCEMDVIDRQHIPILYLKQSGFVISDKSKLPTTFEEWREEILKKEGIKAWVYNKEKKSARNTSSSSFNFASIDCGAKILDVTKEAKSPQAVLKENKDEYLLFKCQSERFVTIELCEEIVVDQVEIANYEFFSSMFKELKLSIIDQYPSGTWRDLDQFQANNTRSLQRFDVSNPKTWSKYLRIDFKDYYGNEFFCPISSIRVHGSTMMQQFKEIMGILAEEQNDDTAVRAMKATHSHPSGHIPFPSVTNEEISANTTQVVKLVTVEKMIPVEVISEKESSIIKIPSDKMSSSSDTSGSSALPSDALAVLSTPVVKSDTSKQTKIWPSQEGVFKTIFDRLTLAELDSSLARRYLDEKISKLAESLLEFHRMIRNEWERMLFQEQNERQDLQESLNAKLSDHMKEVHTILNGLAQKIRMTQIHLFIHDILQLIQTIAIVLLILICGRLQLRSTLSYLTYYVTYKWSMLIETMQKVWYNGGIIQTLWMNSSVSTPSSTHSPKSTNPTNHTKPRSPESNLTENLEPKQSLKKKKRKSKKKYPR